MRKTFRKEEFIKLDGQDKPQKSFYDPKQKANNKTLADMPKTVKLNDSSKVINVVRLCICVCRQIALSERHLVI